jgi:beta-fructofuranosidase
MSYLPLLQGIPRTIALDSKTGINLIQWPIEEIESLRGHKLSQTDVKLDAGAVVKFKGAAGNQVSKITLKGFSHSNSMVKCAGSFMVLRENDCECACNWIGGGFLLFKVITIIVC